MAVAKKVGISKDTVKSFCRKNGLTVEMVVAAQPQEPECRNVENP